MKVLLVEWLTGGGLFLDHKTSAPSAILSSEMTIMGTAMVSAIAADLADFADVRLLWDNRLPTPSRATSQRVIANKTYCRIETTKISNSLSFGSSLSQQAPDVDAILLIAPESDGRLVSLIQMLGSNQDKLISPSQNFSSLASNKNKLAEQLRDRKFLQIPGGYPLADFFTLDDCDVSSMFPAVVKPIDGAGSEDVVFIKNRNQLENSFLEKIAPELPSRFRIEKFVPGTAVSVSVIAGPAPKLANPVLIGSDFQPSSHASGDLILKPLRQMFDRAPIGNYVKSVDDLNGDQIARAQQLVQDLLPHLPSTVGYFGVDLVLSDTGATDDVVIEVNPRLTMSYLQLREIFDFNLAAEMVKRAENSS